MPTPPEPGFFDKIPLWLRIVVIVLGTFVVGVVGLWLMSGGWKRISAMLPPSVVQAIGGTPGEKVVPQTADPEGAPWEKHPGAADDADKDEQPKKKAAKVEDEPEADAPPAPKADRAKEEADAVAALAPIKARAAEADAAIEKMRDHPDDQQAYLDANKAVEALAGAMVRAETDALRTSALEFRTEVTAQKRKDLEEARRLGRATHSVQGTGEDASAPYLVLREAANSGAADVAHMQDGDLVRVQIDLDTGWVKVEALSGEAMGKSGYAKSHFLAPIKRGHK